MRKWTCAILSAVLLLAGGALAAEETAWDGGLRMEDGSPQPILDIVTNPRDPEVRTTPSGDNVTSFTVAVNRRTRRDPQSNQPDADFFRVSAWRQLGENCGKYLAKGRKVCVSGPVSARTYQANDGTTRVSLEVTADDVEFLTSRAEADAMGGGSYTAPAASAPAPTPAPAPASESQSAGFTAVETDELPF